MSSFVEIRTLELRPVFIFHATKPTAVEGVLNAFDSATVIRTPQALPISLQATLERRAREALGCESSQDDRQYALNYL